MRIFIKKNMFIVFLLCVPFLLSNLQAGLQKRPEHCLVRVSGYFASLKNWYDDSYPDFFSLFRADLREYLRTSNVSDWKRCILRSIGKMERRDYFISSYMLADPDLKEIEPDPSLAVETGKILLKQCLARMTEECKRFQQNLLAGLAINSYRIGNHSEAKKYKAQAYEWMRGEKEEFGARTEEEWNLFEKIE
ncbi:hypothetical protein [Leptospira stimsonii]|nr:hypothetical protein [Leptospira stimsonii]